MVRWVLILVLFLLAGPTHGWKLTDSQKKIRVINFDQLEPVLHLSNDTVYLVNFWATWCAPCIAEMPAIMAVEKKYSDKKFKVLLVSLDMPGQLNSRVIPFVRSNKITADVILLDDPNQNRWIDKVDKQWSGEIPYTLIYGKNFRDSYTQPQAYQDRITEIDQKYKSKGYPVIAINPNDPELAPADSFDKMVSVAKDKGFTFPYLMDEKQEVYRRYGATKTPHVYVLQKSGTDLVVQYIGAIDDNYQDASKVSSPFLANALDALIAGSSPEPATTKAIGCGIKDKNKK